MLKDYKDTQREVKVPTDIYGMTWVQAGVDILAGGDWLVTTGDVRVMVKDS